MSGLSDTSAFDTFDRMAEKVDQMEAEAEAGAELAEEFTGDVLSHKFRELEATAGADQELEALKIKMGLVEPEPTPAVETRVELSEEEEISEDDMAELEEALAELKQREMGS
jgi:phage shock protein A